MALKFRHNGIKREHNIVKGLLPILERIATCPWVQLVIPGRIKASQGVTSIPRLKIQLRTLSGLKLSARSGNAVQEVFIVTSKPTTVIGFLEQEVPEFEAKMPAIRDCFSVSRKGRG